jgi:hypothetical protein
VENTSKDQDFSLVSSEGVVLTKDNLAKKNWKGSQQCVYCNFNETIQHLFLYCPSAKMIWRIIFYATNLTQPRSISHMFGTWLNNQHKDYKPLIGGWCRCHLLGYLEMP